MVIKMVSITDNVKKALKDPITDYRKTLIVGVLFAIIDICIFFIFDQCYNILKIIENTDTHITINGFPKMADVNLQIIIVLAVICIILAIPIMGLMYNSLNSAFNKKEGNILANGVKYFTVSLVYNLIPAILFYLGFTVWINNTIGHYLMICSLIVYIIFDLMLIFAIPHLVYTDSIREALDIRKIINLISNFGWLRYIGAVIFIAIIFTILLISSQIIFSILTGLMLILINNPIIIPVLAIIIYGLIATPYLTLFLNKVCGLMYLECIEK